MGFISIKMFSEAACVTRTCSFLCLFVAPNFHYYFSFGYLLEIAMMSKLLANISGADFGQVLCPTPHKCISPDPDENLTTAHVLETGKSGLDE